MLTFSATTANVRPGVARSPQDERRPMKREWTDEEDKEILALIARGLTRAQIAAKLGIPKSAVLGRSYRLLKGLATDEEARRDRVKFNLIEAIDLYVLDWSINDLSSRYGVSRAAIRRQFEKNGIKMRNRAEATALSKART